MPLPKKKLIPSILLMLALVALAAPPLWWSQGNPPIIVPGAPQNNKGPANIGQAKHMAKSALDALRPILPNVTAQIEADLAPILDLTVPNPKPAAWAEKQKAPLLIGQLKAISAPFYTRLHAVAPTWLAAERSTNGTNHPGSIFPWTPVTTDDNNKGIANIGQLKAVFSLRFEPLTSYDTDGDGMEDAWEIANFDNILQDADGDADGDNLTNLKEFQHGTNPTLPDTDGDGLTDSDEILTHMTAPLNPDTDGDSLKDGVEILTHMTAPLNPDTDGDGMPDGWEIQYALNPLIPTDAALDPDADGFTNLQEFQFGTHPSNPDTDGDSNSNGLPDGWELFHFGGLGIANPNASLQPDGLTNKEKAELGLSPNTDYSAPSADQPASYTFDPVGRLTGVTAPVGAGDYTPDEEGNLLNAQ